MVWQVDHTERALYIFLLDKIKAKPSFKLQAFLHAPIKNRAVIYCDELASTQPHIIVQQLYAASAEAGKEGLAPFLAVPTNPHNTFSPAHMLILYRRQFGLPLATLQSQASLCPGCKETLDVYGIHLLNCKHISTKDSSDTHSYNRTIIHDSLGDRVVQLSVAIQVFCMPQVKPSGALFQPTLTDGSTGRLDLKYVKRGDEGGKTQSWLISPLLILFRQRYLRRVMKALSRGKLLLRLVVKNMPSMIYPHCYPTQRQGFYTTPLHCVWLFRPRS